jgi:hypothetical protein
MKPTTLIIVLALMLSSCSYDGTITNPDNHQTNSNSDLTHAPMESGWFSVGRDTFRIVTGIAVRAYQVQYNPASQFLSVTTGKTDSVLTPMTISFYHAPAAPHDFVYSQNGIGVSVSYGYDANSHSSISATAHITMFDTVNNLVSLSFTTTVARYQHPEDTLHISGQFNELVIDDGAFHVGTMSATIDGLPWVANIAMQNKLLLGKNFANTLNGLKAGLQLTGIDADTIPRRSLWFESIPLQLGVHSIGDQPKGWFDRRNKTYDYSNDNYRTSSASGTITITKIDTLRQRVSGTFEFHAKNNKGDEVQITDGRFDDVLWQDE